MNETVLKVSDLCKTFYKDGSTVEAVKDVSFELAQGEILGIAGESGCGKTTLSRLCVGLLKPDSGRIEIAGEKLGKKMSRTMRRNIQTVFQNPATTFNPAYSLGSALRGVGGDLGVPREECEKKIAELLKLTGLSEDILKRRPKELSGGQLQRLATVRALLCEPKVLIADEAVSSLDVSVAANIINLFSDLRQSLGIAILFISHDLAVIGHISDRVGVMYKGRLIEQGTVGEVMLNPREEYTKRLLDSRL